jgi:hypothetical protein
MLVYSECKWSVDSDNVFSDFIVKYCSFYNTMDSISIDSMQLQVFIDYKNYNVANDK